MVEDVENFPPKLELDSLGQFRLFKQRPVKFLEIIQWEDVTTDISGIPQQWLDKWEVAAVWAKRGRVG